MLQIMNNKVINSPFLLHHSQLTGKSYDHWERDCWLAQNREKERATMCD